jgi:hypothetical protein
MPSVMEAALETTPATAELYAWIAEQTPDADGLYVINSWDQVSLPALNWYLSAENGGDTQTAVSGALLQSATADRTAVLREEVQRSASTYLVILEGGPWGAPFWPDYTEALMDILEPVARKDFQIELIDTGSWQDEVLLREAAWEQVKAASREELAVSVIVYRIR